MAFKYPWTNLHELNLDWILSQIRQLTKQIAKFTGLTASAHSVPYGSDPTVDITGGTGNDPYNLDFGIPESASSAVNTVNGQSGDVVLTASDIGLGNVDNVQQYSATNPPPYPVTSVNGQTGAVTVTAPVTSVNGMTGDVIVSGGGGSGDVLSVNGQNGVVVLDKTDIGLGNVDNVQQYSATNPPPYPVTSVNGQTGDVTIAGAVDSVNGQTGTVVLGSKVTAPISATASAITLNEAYMVQIGNLVSYSFEFVTSENINYSFLSGFANPEVGTIVGNVPVGKILSTTGISYNVKLFAFNGSLSLSDVSVLPAGTYQGCVTYITAS